MFAGVAALRDSRPDIGAFEVGGICPQSLRAWRWRGTIAFARHDGPARDVTGPDCEAKLIRSWQVGVPITTRVGRGKQSGSRSVALFGMWCARETWRASPPEESDQDQHDNDHTDHVEDVVHRLAPIKVRAARG